MQESISEQLKPEADQKCSLDSFAHVMVLEEKVKELDEHNKYLAKELSRLVLVGDHVRKNRSVENELRIN